MFVATPGLKRSMTKYGDRMLMRISLDGEVVEGGFNEESWYGEFLLYYR